MAQRRQRFFDYGNTGHLAGLRLHHLECPVWQRGGNMVSPQAGPDFISAPVHDWITEVLQKKHGFSNSAYSEISWAMAYQDIPESEAFLTATNHFDDNKILESLRVVETRKKRIRELLADVATNDAKRAEFYTMFGQILHALQDFYSHSNYIELNMRNNSRIRSLDDIPLINWTNRPSELKTGYFYWRGLPFDWEKFKQLDTCINGLRHDFPGVNFRNPSDYCAFMDCGWGVFDPKKYKSFNAAIGNATSNLAELHYYLNKDDWSTPMGSQVHLGSGKNIYEFARHLAEKETERQWQEIESTIRANYGAKADRVITAIKTNSSRNIAGGLPGETVSWRLSATSLSPNQSFQVHGPILSTSEHALIIVPSGIVHNNWNRVVNAASGANAIGTYKTGDSASTMQAPVQSGSYDMRVYIYNGAEEASLPFTVMARQQTPSPPQTQIPSWSLSKTQLKPHEQYWVQVTPLDSGQPSYPVAIVGTGAPHGNYYQTEGFAAQRIQQLIFRNGKSEALTAPIPPGDYHLRVYDFFTKNELATLPFTITNENASSPPPPSPPVQPPPPQSPLHSDSPINPANLPPADCGLRGDETAIPGIGFAGYWQGLQGVWRLVRVAPNTVEGPAGGSSYWRGQETGTRLTGIFADDTGSYNLGHFEATISQNGRCLQGTFTYNEDGGVNELRSFRIKKPGGLPYWESSYLGQNTRDLQRMVGGILPLESIDGPDDLTGQLARASLILPSPSHGAAQSSPPVQSPPENQSPSLRLDKHNYAPGETIRVRFTAGAGLADNAWIGIVPIDTPHGSEADGEESKLTYEYVHGQLSGVIEMEAPEEPGRYDIRFYDRDDNGYEIASITFVIR